jgi:hypothetical protein
MNGQNNFIKNKTVNFSRFVILRYGCFIYFFLNQVLLTCSSNLGARFDKYVLEYFEI